jgi:hypothetical protein
MSSLLPSASTRPPQAEESRLERYLRGRPAFLAGPPEGCRRGGGGPGGSDDSGGGTTSGQRNVTRRGRVAGGRRTSAGDEAAAGLVGGRPRGGGTAGCTSGGNLQGLRRRVETVSCLVPTWSLKKRKDLSRTRYGPSYIGDRGGCAPSRRTRTKRVSRSSSGRLSGPGRLWWSAEGGVLLLSVCCSSWRNVGDGGSGELRNWPGRTGCAPKTASAGENCEFSLHADLMPSRTHGKWAYQSAPAAQARNASLRRR